MSEHTHTTYGCDRCKADMGNERPKRSQGAVIDAAFNWADGPGPQFKWRDLCSLCDSTVKAFFLEMSQPALSEKREARAMFQALIEQANRDPADWIMVRARRMLGGWSPTPHKDENHAG